ncbi:MAG: hypothetical protein ABSF53_06475 [Terracidiphilus sp.]
MEIVRRVFLASLCFAVAISLTSSEAHSQELNTNLMNSTFEIFGPSAVNAGTSTTGTIFILGKPRKEDPATGYTVLITAAHVLNEIAGDEATLVLRKKGSDGTFSKYPYPIKIRRNGINLFVTNPDADVVAMYLAVPKDAFFQLLPIGLLADDNTLKRLEIHPGDELFALGFPLVVDLNSFPVLRTGTLASYPITPTKTIRTFMFTFHIFPGNSGGPVYFSFESRTYGGVTHLGSLEQAVIGLVSQQGSSSEPSYKDLPLDLAVVVPSSYIIDTIALLPETP